MLVIYTEDNSIHLNLSNTQEVVCKAAPLSWCNDDTTFSTSWHIESLLMPFSSSTGSLIPCMSALIQEVATQLGPCHHFLFVSLPAMVPGLPFLHPLPHFRSEDSWVTVKERCVGGKSFDSFLHDWKDPSPEWQADTLIILCMLARAFTVYVCGLLLMKRVVRFDPPTSIDHLGFFFSHSLEIFRNVYF